MAIAEATARRAPRALARRLARVTVREVPMLTVLAALLAEPATRRFALVNLAVQAALFAFGACLPAWRTGVMAFTDGAWPLGLVAIGAQALAFGAPASGIVAIVAGMYIVMGLRGGLWAAVVAVTDFPRDDLPRYRYRRLVWEREGYRSQTLPMVHEILEQGLLNASVLAAPAIVAVAGRHTGVGAVAICGAALWAASWALESLADVQKARFGRRCAAAGVTRTCNAGLWARSRHPNYFFEWLVWIGIALVALPALLRLADHIALLAWLGLAVGLLCVPVAMYYVLVHATGVIPSEHFSAQHRPDYRDYQRRVNRFFPAARRR